MVFVDRRCKDSVGGIDKVYIFKHIKYSRSQIVLNGNILVSYPSTTIFEFQANNDVNVTQNQSVDSGGKFFELNFTLDLVKENPIKYDYLLNFDVNIIVKDNLGNYRFLGNINGLTCTQIVNSKGSSKTDFNGVKLTFIGREEKEAWYIDNLENAGFGDAQYLLQEDGFYLLQENGFKILL